MKSCAPHKKVFMFRCKLSTRIGDFIAWDQIIAISFLPTVVGLSLFFGENLLSDRRILVCANTSSHLN